jgi:hypothetical protein
MTPYTLAFVVRPKKKAVAGEYEVTDSKSGTKKAKKRSGLELKYRTSLVPSLYSNFIGVKCEIGFSTVNYLK